MTLSGLPRAPHSRANKGVGGRFQTGPTEPATASALGNWGGPGSSQDITVFTCHLEADKSFV